MRTYVARYYTALRIKPDNKSAEGMTCNFYADVYDKTWGDQIMQGKNKE